MKRSVFLMTFVVLGLTLLLTSFSCGSIASGDGPAKVEVSSWSRLRAAGVSNSWSAIPGPRAIRPASPASI